MKLHELDIALQREILKCAGECLVKQYSYDGMTGKNQAARILESVTNGFLQLYPDIRIAPSDTLQSAPPIQTAQTPQSDPPEPTAENIQGKNQESQDTAKRPYNRRQQG